MRDQFGWWKCWKHGKYLHVFVVVWGHGPCKNSENFETLPYLANAKNYVDIASNDCSIRVSECLIISWSLLRTKNWPKSGGEVSTT